MVLIEKLMGKLSLNNKFFYSIILINYYIIFTLYINVIIFDKNYYLKKCPQK